MAVQVDFDFDLMVRLAREAPAEFARRREELILGTIATFRSPEAGHRFQLEIDAERMRSAPGEQTCLAIAKRMNASLRKMSALLADIQTLAKREIIRR
jgi:hypothetical protein